MQVACIIWYMQHIIIYAPFVGRYDSVARVDVVNLLSNYFQLVSGIVSRPVHSRN